MPNWVYSGFVVTGDPGEIARLKEKAFREVPSSEAFASLRKEGTETILDFGAIVPMPPEAADDPTGWAWDNWGVKWNAMDLSIRDMAPDGFQFQFTTAWEFPKPVFEVLAAEFPTLVFDGSSYEDGGAFRLAGQINGDDSWGPVDSSRNDEVDHADDDDEEDEDVDAGDGSGEGR